MKKLTSTPKRQMQNVSFKTIDDFLEYLPADELKIVTYLRSLILNTIPGCIEKLSYNVPYYSRHSRICFLWPASVSWGNMQQSGVRLGFTSGYLLQDEINYLNKGDRKQVYWKDFTSIQEIETVLLNAYLHEAILIDEQRAKMKKR